MSQNMKFKIVIMKIRMTAGFSFTLHCTMSSDAWVHFHRKAGWNKSVMWKHFPILIMDQSVIVPVTIIRH